MTRSRTSVTSAKIESMFDSAVELEPEALADADDDAVVAAIEGWARVTAAADARRLAAIAELTERRCGDPDDPDERSKWVCDPWDSCAGEVSAALNIAHRPASGQMHIGRSLRDRLPRLGALYRAGALSSRTVAAAVWRTRLVVENEVLALIDSAMAERATTWGPLSDYKLTRAIDELVVRYDPFAQRETRDSAAGRDVQVGIWDQDDSATTFVRGRLLGSDAQVLRRRLAQMIADVCEDDPRTHAQRRADALGALAAGSLRLACACGTPQCPAAGVDDGRARSLVVHVLTDQSALGQSTSASEAKTSPETGADRQASPPPNNAANPQDHQSVAPEHKSQHGGTPEEAAEPLPHATSDAQPSKPPALFPAGGLILGGGIIPAPLLTELIRAGATVRILKRPPDEPEPHYRPSAALAEFVRCRDLTCRFPGCDRPADYCDLDHAVPWPDGLTHPSNLRCLCRLHHLMKTFWAGPDGWSDRQLPDGTIIWTSPSSRTYVTHPGSRLLVPGWEPSTAPLPPTDPAASCRATGDRGAMMPLRRRTRIQDRHASIKAERARNEARSPAPDTDEKCSDEPLFADRQQDP